ncbi:ABC transporter substrate binding protein [Anaeromicrobium sediminis]|uniref:Diguanylate cyclase n=1 Tax=Anaeromicrobium sediminis TaxID=1478221 RepID=A0A267MBT0_9FIRM|nr:ABC transporter substrate binding protein [Anaeromicrobium sediminis]PAB56325.1 hypothetical protein CCE28_21065 [Anaeromicrobium sediminis]
MKNKIFGIVIIFIMCFQIISYGEEKNRVLVINSYSPTFISYDRLEAGIRSVLKKENVNLHMEYMDSKRFSDETHLRNFYESLSYKLSNGEKYDLIMATDDNALLFVEKYYDELFKGLPVVFSGVNDIEKGMSFNENPNFTGVLEAISLRETLDIIGNFQRNVSNVYFIMDKTTSSDATIEEIKNTMKYYENLKFRQLSLKEMSFDQLFSKISRINKKDSVIIMSAFKDMNDKSMTFEESLNEIIKNSKAPVYHLWEHGIGNGIVGGKVVSQYEQARTAATIALNILNGEEISIIKVVEKSPNKYIFDYKELKKHDISLNKIPNNSTILNKPFEELRKYKVWIQITIGFIFLSFVIIIILYKSILTRNKVEKELKIQKSYFKQLFEKSPEAILILDEYERVNHINKSFIELFKVNIEDIKGKTVEEVAIRYLEDEITIEQVMANWEDKLKSGEIYKDVVSINGRSGNRHLKITAYAIKNDSNYMGAYIICSDITNEKEREDTIEYLAYKDPLTDLYNRRFFNDKLKEEVQKGKDIAVMFMDLDGFKKINDTLGHGAGDIILKTCSQRLIDIMGKGEIIARMGGDEFIALFTNPEKINGIIGTSQKIIESIEEPFYTDKEKIYLSASIGIAKYPEHGQDSGTLIKNADIAMYKAKKRKEEKIEIYVPELDEKIQEEFIIENNLRGALGKEEISVNYQPILNTHTNKIIGAETLIRWNSPELGYVSPFNFIPIAEQNGMIHEIGRWVLREACRQNKEWQNNGYDHMFIAVNVSVKQLEKKDFAKTVIDILNETGLDPKYLELEITETVYMENMDKIINVLKELDEVGVKFSIDDFGTGYSSLGELTRLDISKLKIDKSFIQDVFVSDNNAKVVEAIISMANSLNLNIVAEGVETKEQYDFLREQRCNMVQGYLFSKPLDSINFEELLKSE